jgi:murein DD-endopeptidase MepM/ murein hydrolase activator NlpD
MQFLMPTWRQYAVDANGDGVADPYNPEDAIFTAARYLDAAGASKNIGGAIFAYNHAEWYVQSVELRAKLISAIPTKLVDALTGLFQGYFPVGANARYADDNVKPHKSKGSNAAAPVVADPHSTSTTIYANQNAPAIAVDDGKISALGHSPQLGNYIELQDATGNVYTYAHLGSIPKSYAVPKPVKVTAAEIARQLKVPTSPKPAAPATAGSQQTAPTPSVAKAANLAKSTPTLPVTTAPAAAPPKAPADAPASIPQPLAKVRLFAYPTRTASFAAGGLQQVKSSGPQIGNFRDYFSGNVLHLAKHEYTLQPLKVGALVVAGTIIGRIGTGTPSDPSHMNFRIRPAGPKAPYIDPKPVLDGWKLLDDTAVYRAHGLNKLFGKNKSATVGQVLLMSKQQLTSLVLSDPRIQIYACGRRDIQAGLIARQVMATLEYLATSGLYPTVSGLQCGHSLNASTGVDAAGATGASVDISAINNTPVLGHQGPNSVTDLTIRKLLNLQGAMRPDAIVSLMSFKGQNHTLSLPDHRNRIQISFTPLYGTNKKLAADVANVLQRQDWVQLANRLNQIAEPVVPINPSKYAIKVAGQ